MPTITFRRKPFKVGQPDGTERLAIDIPREFTRSHCDMRAFRADKEWRDYANSDLFAGMLKKATKSLHLGEWAYVDELESLGATVRSGLLYTVTLQVPSWR